MALESILYHIFIVLRVALDENEPTPLCSTSNASVTLGLSAIWAFRNSKNMEASF